MRTWISVLAAVFSFTLAAPAMAEPLVLGTTSNPAPAAAFIADQQGIFKKNGLDVTIQLISSDPTIPAALLSNSIQIASVTPPTFLTAVASGIDLVALTGTTITTKTSHDVAIVVSKASGVTSPKGLEGKTLGVPGLGAILDVMLRAWLAQHDVDPKTIRFVEMPFPQQADQLRAGRVDGVITVEQFAQRMIGDGTGIALSYPLSDLPNGLVAQVIAVKRSWAIANPKAVAAIRASMSEAEKIAKTNPAALRTALGNAMQLPDPIVQRMTLPDVDTSLEPAQLAWWANEMKRQGLLKTTIDAHHLLVP